MINPFCRLRSLDNPDDWVGDREEFDALAQHLAQGNNVVILGEQGSGKTSLLKCFFTRQKIQELIRERTLICWVDFSSLGDGRDMCQYLADVIKEEVRFSLRNTEDYSLVMEMLSIKADSPKALLQQIVNHLCRCEYRLWLIMDNFERFTSSPSVTMEHHETLRTQIVGDQLRCIIATNHDLSKDSLPSGVKGSYLVQMFTEKIQMRPLSEDDTAAYLKRQQADCDKQLSDGLIKDLYLISGGIPLFLEMAARSAFDVIHPDDGETDVDALFESVYRQTETYMNSWCDCLSPSQKEALKELCENTDDTAYQAYDFTGESEAKKTGVNQLIKRGLVTMIDESYPYEVTANSLLFQRYCRDRLTESIVSVGTDNQMENDRVSSGNSYTQITNYVVHIDNRKIEFHQGLSVRELLQLVTDGGMSGLREAGTSAARQLSARLGAAFRSLTATLPSPPPEVDSDPQWEQAFDDAFDQASRLMIKDVEVDENDQPVISAEERQTIEERFRGARVRCRPEITDAFLLTQSPRCQFYLKLAVVVEDALNLPGSVMGDYSPQLILYGKALEQSMRENFYELFSSEETLAACDFCNKGRQNRNSNNTFGRKHCDQTFIGNYYYLIRYQIPHLAALCHDHDVHMRDGVCDEEWWKQMKSDIYEAKELRNLAGHADENDSPTPQHLDQLCGFLFDADGAPGILTRALIGKELLRNVLSAQSQADSLTE